MDNGTCLAAPVPRFTANNVPALRRAVHSAHGGRVMRIFAVLIAALLAAPALAQHGSSASNMALLGSDDLQARSAYQPVVHNQGGRWIAYVGHHGGRTLNPLSGRQEDNGTSIVDVSDPRAPSYLAHIPGEPGSGETGGAQMVHLCT